MGKAIDLTGQRFGRWTVLERAKNGNRTSARWLCQCDCGNVGIVEGYSLRRGGSLSCGCLQRERAGEIHRKHGNSKSRLHYIWRSMLQRCSNPHNSKYPRYGGRGIGVCSSWKEFESFYDWAMTNGYSDELTLDRIDVNGNYEPSNCRWASWTIQQRNRSDNHFIFLNGQKKCLTEWCAIYGISRQTVQSRLSTGWSEKEALTTPAGSPRNRRTTRWISFNGQRKCLAEWAELTGISISNLHRRLSTGWSVEESLTIPLGQKRKKP